MELQHVNVKFFVADPQAVDLELFLSVFNGWIQQTATEELLIDVADYRHVPAGPGIILIGHEANYSLDNEANRLGLLYNRKAPVAGSNRDRLRQAVRAALLAAQRLSDKPGLRFEGGGLQLVINDRLLAPNSAETLNACQPELTAFFDTLYGGARCTLERRPDPRERFTLEVRAEGDFEVGALLRNMS